VFAKSRTSCLTRLRRAAGEEAILTIDVVPSLVGVAEAAQILGWDRRRVITYVDRGSFPSPVASLASGRVWRRDDVEAFARTVERRRERRR
jgi:predicted DNA-binding transcriptional regulator AlpA